MFSVRRSIRLRRTSACSPQASWKFIFHSGFLGDLGVLARESFFGFLRFDDELTHSGPRDKMASIGRLRSDGFAATLDIQG